MYSTKYHLYFVPLVQVFTSYVNSERQSTHKGIHFSYFSIKTVYLSPFRMQNSSRGSNTDIFPIYSSRGQFCVIYCEIMSISRELNAPANVFRIHTCLRFSDSVERHTLCIMKDWDLLHVIYFI